MAKGNSAKRPRAVSKRAHEPGSLKTYDAKRDFSVTTEPRAKRTKVKGNRFAVQKHAARRLHFDLRLELDGVLKSWAVTRGPSLVPGEKRLSIHTEDHPLEYLTFEGVIPAGQYGGGTMIVWDEGRWLPEGDPHKAYAEGRLTFTLEGRRLKGRWHLVRTRPKPRETKEQWLLLKSEDEHARAPGAPEIVEEEAASIRSGRTIEELAREGELRIDHRNRIEVEASRPDARRKTAKIAGARKAILPPFVEPSLAKLVASAPTGPHWLHEIKFDGYRIQARIDGGKVRLLTRKGLDWTRKFSSIAEALKELRLPSALIDGEIVVEDESGVSDFSALQQDLSTGRTDRMIFYAFDLLYLDGQDLRQVPLQDRKALLQLALDDLPEGGTIRFSEHIAEDGASLIRHACRMGLEGIVSKRADQPYKSGRGEHWLKSKCTQRQEFVVAGYVPSSTSRKAVGSLVLGYYDGKDLVHVGRTGTGFTAATARSLWAQISALEMQASPFHARLSAEARRNVRWMRPELVAEVEYRGWTHDGHLRHAAFKGLREDKDPREVVREDGTVSAPPATSSPALASARLTHPDRVLWEDEGLTKLGLAEFYTEIADWILPHIVDRPLSLLRCPSGSHKECFFQKHAWAGLDESLVQRVSIGDDEVLAIRDLRGFLALVQAGVLEIHPWGSKLKAAEKPDRIVFDLDPGENVAWPAVVEGAQEVRQRLKDLGLESFVKTTGGKGLHVVVPVKPRAGWDATKAFAERVALAMAKDAPDRYTASLAKRAREGRIFIDYLRNGRGATAVAPYSTRARSGAPVSTPLSWSELPSLQNGSHYRVANLAGRLQHMGEDPWHELTAVSQSLTERLIRRL
ncbi:DNA ligase D [Microvirga lenta]|uniref:DNA ligase D n=1 Tax=Microvirga lenta TaxID=2881337 RepID=UPI001CFFBADA|nr:DNA ligase D [Microvirga lenta]